MFTLDITADRDRYPADSLHAVGHDLIMIAMASQRQIQLYAYDHAMTTSFRIGPVLEGPHDGDIVAYATPRGDLFYTDWRDSREPTPGS